MNARRKLNVSYLNGCLIIAAAIGLAAGSWPVFLLAMIVLMLGCIHAGEIRLEDRK